MNPVSFPLPLVKIQHALHYLDKLVEQGAQPATIVHPTAWVSPSAQIGAGTVVFAQAAVNSGA
jgi:UDP-3-O-[3-hydroxymyristoyl] glucosamine N-acyltransferase